MDPLLKRAISIEDDLLLDQEEPGECVEQDDRVEQAHDEGPHAVREAGYEQTTSPPIFPPQYIEATCSPEGGPPERPPPLERPRIPRRHERRRRQRNALRSEGGQQAKPHSLRKWVMPAVPIATSLITEGLPVALGAYAGLHEGPKAARLGLLVGPMAEDFELVQWNGRLVAIVTLAC